MHSVVVTGVSTRSCIGRWPLVGFYLAAVALWAQMPDLLYIQGYYHRDWMDVFLFHIALDEIIALSLPTLAVLWAVLMVAYVRFRLGGLNSLGADSS
jgi:hypothetical protein